MSASWAQDFGISLDHRGEVPLGVQLDWSIRAAVADGRLGPGERLPALRELADELGVNHNTLRAAVAKLEADGLLESRHGTGTFVAADAAAHQRHAPLVEQVVRWAADAGLSPRELAAALYVAAPAAPAAPGPADTAAEERRALRDEIAMLERLLARQQARLPRHVPPQEPELRPRGARLLGAAELHAQRDALVRHLAAVQRALDDDEEPPPGGDGPAAESQPAPEPRRAPAQRRAPRPGISPA